MPQRIPAVLTNGAAIAGMLVLAAYWVFAPFFPVPIVEQLVNAMLASVAVAVSCAYAPDAYKRLASREPGETAGSYLSLGIACRWLTDVGWRTFSILWLLGGLPEWMIHNYVVPSFIVLGCYSGSLHLAAKQAIDGEIPRGRYVKVGLWLGAGCFVGWLIVSRRPDLTAFVARLEPYVPRCPWGSGARC